MSIWSNAAQIASQTPDNRNRYVDFLRAASILFVISGHWLIATAFFDHGAGTLTPVTVLDVMPSTQWLTWLFQVMPIFFIVGGYSNAISLERAREKGVNYAGWLVNRLHRLLTPLLSLILLWALLSLVLRAGGVSEQMVSYASQAALVPVWFLAIYTMIVLLAPVAYIFWRRFGASSVLLLILLAGLVDLAYLSLEIRWLGWTNYFWVWLAMHQLGFAWFDRRVPSISGLLVLSVLAMSCLLVLILYGPYPVAMAGSPEGDVISNTLPPKITLVALGLFQFGLLLAVERPMHRVLQNQRLWTFTVLISSMIMTIYLWHMTLLIALLGLCWLFDGAGIDFAVGGAMWWWTRPIWLLVLTVMLLPVALLMSPLERLTRSADSAVPSAWRLVSGAILVGGGLVFASLQGFSGDFTSPANIGAVVLVLGGAAVCGLPLRIR